MAMIGEGDGYNYSDDDINNESKDGSNDSQTRDQIEIEKIKH